MQEITEQEMKQVSGGETENMICLLKGHDWREVRSAFRSDGLLYKQYVCMRCGKYMYTVTNKTLGVTMEITESQFRNGIHL